MTVGRDGMVAAGRGGMGVAGWVRRGVGFDAPPESARERVTCVA